MPHTLIEIFSIVVGRPARRHHKHDPYVPAKRIHDLGLRRVTLTFDSEIFVMNVTGTFTAPVARKSGTPLALTDIDHFSLRRNGVEIQVLAPTGPTITWTDATPLTGADAYDVFTVTKDGFISDSSNDAVVTVVTADPAAAIVDLAATLNP